MQLSCVALLLTLTGTGIVFAQSKADASEPPLPSTPTRQLADLAEARRWSDLLRASQIPGSQLLASQPDGATALHWAALHDHASAIRKLVDAGVDIDAVNEYQVSALSVACEAGSQNAALALIDAGADVNAVRLGMETPLMLAARQGNAEVVEQLIENGADANATEKAGQTALIWAAAEGNLDVIDRLLKSEAKLDYRVPKTNFSALLYAARQGQTAAVIRLLDAGADINSVIDHHNAQGRKPRKSMSAMMLAVESGHLELALELVKRGADPNDGRSGYGPLHAITWVRKAERGDNPEGDPEPRITGTLTTLDFVREMVDAGSDVNLQIADAPPRKQRINPSQATPFLLAARGADLPLMELLLELGADPNLSNADATTPIMAAAGVGVIAVGEEPGTTEEVNLAIAMLHRLGNDVNAVDANGETVMHGAALRNFDTAVTLLASLGADPKIWNQKNKRGWTPLDIAGGKRPGSVKPSPPTVAALQRALQEKNP